MSKNSKDLNIAVRELAEYTLQEGDLNLESFMSSSRAVAGTRAHQKIQKARPDEYEAEVPISFTLEQPKFNLNISGRVDGIYTYDDRVIIDEIKSTTKPVSSFAVESNKIHWGQAKIYAYIYATQQGLPEIWVQLTYYNIDTKQQRELLQKYTKQELEQFFSELTSNYLAWAEVIYDWQKSRDLSLSSLEFPFAGYRAGQRQMAVESFRVIRDAQQMLVQAPTGIGKTMATIFPAVKSFSEETIRKIFFFSARTTGKELAKSACVALQKNGAKLKTLVITAKDKICFEPDSACNAEECRYARGYYDRVQVALEDTFREDIFDRECIESYAMKHEVCPFEFTLYLSLWSDFIICDYNYGFDPKVYLRRFFGDDISDRNYAFLVDEAHNLVDRSREMYSASLSKQTILNARRPLKGKLDSVYKPLGELNKLMLKIRKAAEEEGDFLVQEKPDEEFMPLLRKFITSAEKWLSQNQPAVYRKELLDIYFEALWFSRVLEMYDEHYVTTNLREGGDLTVKLFCVDPSLQMSEALKRTRSAIFFSATLTPQDYFSDIFGCDEEAKKMVLPSPFPKKNLLVMQANNSTRYKQREETASEICEILEQMVLAKKGNYLLFFPSYKYLNMIHDLFQEKQSGMNIQIQQQGMTEQEREEFIANFSEESEETMVAFAVMGGVFGEGIDLVGERLDGVAIVGVGLPGISKERDLILNYYNQENSGFEYAYQYPGINRVLQAAGRVIRTETDRGIVLLIDDRFRWSSYRKLLPSNWQMESVRRGERMRDKLERFWLQSSS